MNDLVQIQTTILLIEDDQVDTETIERSLKSYPNIGTLHKVNNATQALEVLRSPDSPVKPPFLILLDISLPQMTGIEFLAELRKDVELKNSLIIVLTNSEAEQDKLAAYDHNVAGYWIKSRVGPDFEKFSEFLDLYLKCVELPPASLPPLDHATF